MWFAISVESGREKEVIELLKLNFPYKDKITEYLFPTETQVKKEKVEEVVIVSGYIFCDIEEEVVVHLRGFIKERKLGEVLGQVKEEEIKKVRGWSSLKEVEKDYKFKKGDRVKFISGPFEGMIGKVISINKKKSAITVECHVFGRATKVDASFSSIEKETL